MHHKSPWFLASAVALAVGTSVASAQDLSVNTFQDDDAILGVWDWWGDAEKTIVWQSDDAGDNENSGSMKLTIKFDNAAADNQYAIGLALAGGSAYNSATKGTAGQYGKLAFDIRWNGDSTASLDAFNTGQGDPGFFLGLATGEWGQTWLGGATLTAGGWQRVEIAIPAGTPDFPGIIFKKWTPGGGNENGLTGTVSISIDNIQLLASDEEPVGGETVLLNGFDDDLSSNGFWKWWGDILQEFFWVDDQDAGGNATSGAMRLSFEFDNSLASNQYSIGYSLSGNGSYNTDVIASAADYTAVALDIKYDSTSSISVGDFNDNGQGDRRFHMGFGVAAGWSQSWISNAPEISEEWQRIVIPIDSATPDFAGLIFKKWQPTGANGLTGTAAFWIDNVSLIRREEKVPLPELSIEPAGPKGLRLVASATGQQYQRQNVVPIVAEETTFFDNPNPVTVIVDFADFPGAEYGGFQSHIFISPDSAGGTSPDWNDPNVIFIQFGNDQIAAQCTFRYKVDGPNNNTMLYGAGVLGTHTAPSILGAWTITFRNNTEITITAPDESSSTFSMPETDAVKFEPTSFTSYYFGVQPNELANIGQSATFSEIAILDGGTFVLNEKFETVDETQAVNPELWTVQANREAVWVINSDSAYWVNWTLPAPNFELFTSESLGSDDDWAPVIPLPAQVGAMRTTLIQSADLPAADEAYFRLQVAEPPVVEEGQ